MKALCIIFAIILFIAPLITWTISTVEGIQFDANCGDYLKLAADANDVNVAEKHLSRAISYIEANNLTHGDTGVFIYKPQNDIGVWYENLKTAQTQLQEMQANGYTELEESNMLMKLRETLMDEERITHPSDISLFPYHVLMFWLNWFLWLPCWVFGGVVIFIACDRY
jgi:hypothetical protein